MTTFSALHRLITAEIAVQEGQLDTLESILVLAGERSSSIPDPHHVIEGDAANRLIAHLLGEEEKHDRVVPLISSEIEHLERRLRRPEGAPPSHMGTLARELEDFSALQADALKSLKSNSGGDLTISAAMASKLFDVLATKLELLRELQDGFVQHRTAEAEEAARSMQQQQTSAQQTSTSSGGVASMISAAIRGAGTNDATKQSLGLKFAKSLVADGVDALASGGKLKKRTAPASSEAPITNHVTTAISTNSNPLDAARRAAKAFLGGREESTASSAASWKNEFHEAVMRTMLQSESPEEALAGVVSRMPESMGRSMSVESHRSGSATSSRSGSEGPSERDARRRNATHRRRIPSTSPSPAPPHHGGGVTAGPLVASKVDMEARDALTTLRDEVDDLQGSTSELLTEANRIIADCDGAVLQLSTENESLRKELHRLQEAAASRRRHIDDSDAQVQKSVKELHQALVDAKQENGTLSRLLSEERSQHSSVRNELTTLQEEFRRASQASLQQRDALLRCKESERNLEESLANATSKLDALVANHAHELGEKDALVSSLRLRVQTLEKEAAAHINDLETSRHVLNDTVRKLERKQSEVKDVKLMFTELEASGRDTKSEVHALRAAIADKDNALSRYANLSRLKEQHGSPSRRVADQSTGTVATPAGAGGGGGASTPRGGASVGGRRGSNGRLVRKLERKQSEVKDVKLMFTELEASGRDQNLRCMLYAPRLVRKLERKQSEVKDVKLMFTELEASGRDTKSEVHALRAAIADKDNALSRYANLSRLKEQHGSPPRRVADQSTVTVAATPAGGGASTPRGGASVGGRRGSNGRLVRLSFDSPARAATPHPQEPQLTSSMRPATMATQRPGGSTNPHHVQKVLADAASLLASIQSTRRSTEAPDRPYEVAAEGGGSRAGAPRVPPSLQAMNGSEDGVAPVTPLTRPQLSQQQLLHDLEEKERHLMSEAASLAEQERSLLDKRSVVSSTLLAQRNQMLMKNAPDDEVEKLNIQISAVMERINQTTAQIQQNKRSVESKMDLMQRQR
ncbi:Hypothetical protein, putative, partial [Bodo saltans]